MLRCQAQLELTLMMCLSDRSTFTLTGALSGRHDGSSPLFLGDLLSSRGVCVFARAEALPPPPIFSKRPTHNNNVPFGIKIFELAGLWELVMAL